MTAIIIGTVGGIILGWALSSIVSKKRRKDADVTPSYERHPHDFGGGRPILKGGIIRRRLSRKTFK